MIIATAEILKKNEIEKMLHTLLNCWGDLTTINPNSLAQHSVERSFPIPMQFSRSQRNSWKSESTEYSRIESFPPTPSASDTAQADRFCFHWTTSRLGANGVACLFLKLKSGSRIYSKESGILHFVTKIPNRPKSKVDI